jgi:hypothetical protein
VRRDFIMKKTQKVTRMVSHNELAEIIKLQGLKETFEEKGWTVLFEDLPEGMGCYRKDEKTVVFDKSYDYDARLRDL